MPGSQRACQRVNMLTMHIVVAMQNYLLSHDGADRALHRSCSVSIEGLEVNEILL